MAKTTNRDKNFYVVKDILIVTARPIGITFLKFQLPQLFRR